MAAVLTCSDARVSPARSFDLPAGSLFVVRVAGNTATEQAVASLSYAVEHLDVPTIVVLGHSHCGAVDAAMSEDVDASLEPLLRPIRPPVAAARCADLGCAVAANVRSTVAAIGHGDGPLGVAVRAGRVAVHGAVLDLVDQTVNPLPPPEQPETTEAGATDETLDQPTLAEV